MKKILVLTAALGFALGAAPAFAQVSYQLDKQFLAVVIEVVGNVDLDGDVVIAVTRAIGEALAAEP